MQSVFGFLNPKKQGETLKWRYTLASTFLHEVLYHISPLGSEQDSSFGGPGPNTMRLHYDFFGGGDHGAGSKHWNE